MSHQEAFDFSPRAVQQENLERVNARIAPAILDFLRMRLKLSEVRPDGREFHASDLHAFVAAATGVSAPASADRILRSLRQRGRLWYDCIDQAQSLYRVEWVK